MPFLPILIIEIISALLISSVTPNAAATIKHSLYQVFPSALAQEDSNPPPDSSVAPPSDTAPAAPSDSQPAQQSSSPSDSSSQPSSSDQSIPANPGSSTPDQLQNPSNTAPTLNPDQTQATTTNNDSTLLNDINSQAQEGLTETSAGPTEMPTGASQTNQSSDQITPGEQLSQSSNPTPESSQSFSVISDEPEVAQASTTVLNSEDIVGGPAETVDTKTVETAQKQDEQIAKANTPQETATLSIDFAKDSVKEVEHNIRSDDFSTASFVTQRLSDHIDTALEQSQKLGSTKLSNQLKSFCRQADLLLRSQQLVVPEQGEQDFEIIRGKCLNISQ